MNPDILEAVLQRQNEERNVARVLQVTTRPGLGIGENYLSLITKLEAEVILACGRKSRRRFILKSVPEDKLDMLNELLVFKQEIMMYTVVLKEMEYLMEEFGDTNEPLWCNLIHYEPYTSILLEDLTDKGFTVMNRKECLDLDHARITLRSIGRFHAMSKVLESRGIIHPNDTKPYAMINDKKVLNFVVYPSLMLLKKIILESWGPAWEVVAERINIPKDEFTNKMTNLGKVDSARFNVLNHGDCWTNNFLFKHDVDGKPIAQRFIDYQICFYNSCGWDIIYFLMSSVLPEIRRKNQNLLIEIYYESLTSSLKRFKYEGRVPQLTEIIQDIERIQLFRLLAAMVHAVTTSDSSQTIDLLEAFASEGKSGHYPNIYQNPKFKQSIGPDLIDLVEKGVI